MIIFFRGLKSFQEEFFDETNNNIISMFDLLLNVDSTSISENIELWNQSSRATNVRRINSANHHRGLSMLLNISSEDYFITTDDFIGLKVTMIQCCQLISILANIEQKIHIFKDDESWQHCVIYWIKLNYVESKLWMGEIDILVIITD